MSRARRNSRTSDAAADGALQELLISTLPRGREDRRVARASPGRASSRPPAPIPDDLRHPPGQRARTRARGRSRSLRRRSGAAVIARDELTAFEALDFIDVSTKAPHLRRAGREPWRIPSHLVGDSQHPQGGVAALRRRRRAGLAPTSFEDVLLPGQHAPADRQHAAVAARSRRSWCGRARRRRTTSTALAGGDAVAAHIRVIATPTAAASAARRSVQHEISSPTRRYARPPVKIRPTRWWVLCHRGRHPVLMTFKTGVMNDGAITGMHVKTLATAPTACGSPARPTPARCDRDVSHPHLPLRGLPRLQNKLPWWEARPRRRGPRPEIQPDRSPSRSRSIPELRLRIVEQPDRRRITSASAPSASPSACRVTRAAD